MSGATTEPQWLADLVREVGLWKSRHHPVGAWRSPQARPRTVCTACGKNVGLRVVDGVPLPWLHQPYPGQPRIHYLWCLGSNVPVAGGDE